MPDLTTVVALFVGGVLSLGAFAGDVAELAAVVAGQFLFVGTVTGQVPCLNLIF